MWLAVASVIAAGCSGGSGKTSTTASASAPNQAAAGSTGATSSNPSASRTDSLYPIKEGNQWDYKVSFGDVTGTESFVMTKVTPGSGYTDVLWTVTSVFNFPGIEPKPVITSYTYRFNDDGTIIVPSQTAKNDTLTIETPGGDGQVFPGFADIVAGKTLNGAYDATATDPQGTIITTHADWTSTGLGTEDVSVPAGSFAACAKLQSVVTLSGSTADFPEGLGGTGTTVSWFARGIGLVKNTLEGGFLVELVSTNVQ